MQRVVTMKLEKVTKGAVRYNEVALDGKPHPDSATQDNKLIGSLYLRKSQMPSEKPTIKVTVEWED